jgi:hypothetical protein
MLNALADGVLGLLLPTAEAGACVPESGRFCRCTGGYYYIYSCSGKRSRPCTKRSTRSTA